MDATHIKTKFEKLGARATIRPLVRTAWRPAAGPVVTAKEALKPDLVRSREQGKRGKRSKRLHRKTDVFIRQGEWFFIPVPDVQVNDKLILPHEPDRSDLLQGLSLLVGLQQSCRERLVDCVQLVGADALPVVRVGAVALDCVKARCCFGVCCGDLPGHALGGDGEAAGD